MTAARWAAVWALAYNVLHHLGALPAGLGDAGGGTRWVDWITLLTPYAVVGSAVAALCAAAADRRSWTIALVGAASYFQGHAINVAANSISNARGGEAPVHLWDEVVGHWLWYAGVALLVVALARAVDAAARPVALVLAVASGLTWTTNALEGTTAVGSLTVAVGLAGWGWRRRVEGNGQLLLAAFGTSAALLTAYGSWHLGFPAPSQLERQLPSVTARAGTAAADELPQGVQGAHRRVVHGKASPGREPAGGSVPCRACPSSSRTSASPSATSKRPSPPSPTSA